MDLVDFSEEAFEKIQEEFEEFSSKLDVPDITYIPMSALYGDNVVEHKDNMPWYNGPTLLWSLENVQISSDYNHVDCRFPVQHVVRPQSTVYPDYRGYAGRVEGGVFKPGDKVMALPSGFETKIDTVSTYDGERDEVFQPMSINMTLEDDLDISRGDMIVKPDNQPRQTQDIDMMVCWMHKDGLQEGKKYAIKHTTKNARCIIKEVKYKVNVNTLHRFEDDYEIGLNDIGRIRIRTTEPLFHDSYRRNRSTGSMIIMDEYTHETVAAGLII